MSGGNFPYDPDARRDTPLALLIKDAIRRDGVMPLHEYVGRCLYDDLHGYYRAREPIGRLGDFITAPEISQTFGELIGLWAAVVWQQMGSPTPVSLTEVGPGRGTLMADALRALQRVPNFLSAATIDLIEISETLTATQRHRLTGEPAKLQWLTQLPLPTIPRIVIANEFLDTLIPWTFVRVGDDPACESAWRFQGVGLAADGHLIYAPTNGQDQHTFPDDTWPDAPVGSLRQRFEADGFFSDLADFRLAPVRQPIAGLLIDYGHTDSLDGDGLQAVRAHRFEHPLTSPGEADLSFQVDFSGAAKHALDCGLAVDGPVTQAEFLGALGIMERASRLIAANPARANEIEMGVARLMAPNGMGTRFKVMGVRSPGLPPLPGFPAD